MLTGVKRKRSSFGPRRPVANSTAATAADPNTTGGQRAAAASGVAAVSSTSRAEDDHEDELKMPSDLECALDYLQRRFEGALPSGLVVRDHLYTVLNNRTEVDRKVKELRQQNKVRVLKLVVGASSEVALITDAAYKAVIARCVSSSRGRGADRARKRAALRRFSRALDSCTQVSVISRETHVGE